MEKGRRMNALSFFPLSHSFLADSGGKPYHDGMVPVVRVDNIACRRTI